MKKRSPEQFLKEEGMTVEAAKRIYRNIIDLVGKKNVGISNALLESFSQIQTNQAIDLVKAQKSRLDDLTAMRDEAEALRQKMPEAK